MRKWSRLKEGELLFLFCYLINIFTHSLFQILTIEKKNGKKKIIKNIDVTVNSSILYNDITLIIKTKLVILC